MGGKRHNNQTDKESPKPEDAGASYFKVIKHNLEKVLKDPHQYASQFNDIVKQLHLHTIYTLDFLKAWLLYNYEQNNMILPTIDQTLIRLVMTVLYEKTDAGKRKGKVRNPLYQKIKEDLGLFYDSYFQQLVPPGMKFESTNLMQVWLYFADDVVKDYENNIKQHFAQYVQRFVNLIYKKKEQMANLKTAEERRDFTKQLQDIKLQILQRQPVTDADFSESINLHLLFMPLPPVLGVDDDQHDDEEEEEDDEIYIDVVEPHHLSNKRLVGIDPNKGDLIYCSGFKFNKGDASDGGQMTSFRYTQNQRRYESKKKFMAKRLENEKARTEISEGCKVQGYGIVMSTVL